MPKKTLLKFLSLIVPIVLFAKSAMACGADCDTCNCIVSGVGEANGTICASNTNNDYCVGGKACPNFCKNSSNCQEYANGGWDIESCCTNPWWGSCNNTTVRKPSAKTTKTPLHAPVHTTPKPSTKVQPKS